LRTNFWCRTESNSIAFCNSKNRALLQEKRLEKKNHHIMDIETEQAERSRVAGKNPANSVKPLDLQEEQQAVDGARLTILNDEIAVLRDRWMRAEAETANIRARAKREVDDARQFAVQKIAADVVEAAENLRRGLDSIPHTTDAEPILVTQLRNGFIGVERNFIDLLKRNGIEKEDPTGTFFNSERHQAISQQISPNHAPGTVLHAATAT
jgi:molecular chaperone GrpE